MTVASFEIAPSAHDSSTRKSRKVNRPAKSSPSFEIESDRSTGSTEHSRIEPPSWSDQVRTLRDKFFEIHQPETAEESYLVECLAMARAKLDAAEQAWQERLRWQRARAAELFDRSQFQRFQTDLKLWRADPWGMQLVIGKTWHSASFLSDLWNAFREALDTRAGLTFEQIKHVILSLGGDWRVDRLDAVRGRMMSSFLALHPDAANFIEHWVCESRASRPERAAIDIELDRKRARAFLESAPSAAQARKCLIEIADEERAEWAEQAQQLQTAHFEEKWRSIEVCPPHPLGDAAEVRETRRIQRVLISAERRFEMLERRLLNLLKSRNRSKPQQSPPVSPPDRPAQPARHDLTQVATKTKDMPNPRNEAANEMIPAPNSGKPERPARRPDPKQAVKAWRTKHGKGRSERNASAERSA